MNDGERRQSLDKQAYLNSDQQADILCSDAAEFLKRSQQHIPYEGAWTKLYAASQTLLSAMREERVFEALAEICSNFLACEQLAVIEIGCQAQMVHVLGEEGLSAEKHRDLIDNAQVLEQHIIPGNCWIPADDGQSDDALAALEMRAVIPLWKDTQSSGAMLLFQLLPQYDEFDAEGRQILQFLTLHAGPCLRSQMHG